MMCDHRTAALLGFVLALAGCGGPQASTSSGARAADASLDPGRKPAYVPRGTEFMAVVETPIDSSTSQVGQPVALALIGPMRSTDPNLTVPAGARIHGTIAGLGRDFLPSVRLIFRSIDTPVGPASIDAVVRYAGETAWVNPHAIHDRAELGYDTILYHPHFRPTLTEGTAIGGGPPALDAPVDPIRLAAGSEIDLILTHPLLLAPHPPMGGDEAHRVTSASSGKDAR